MGKVEVYLLVLMALSARLCYAQQCLEGFLVEPGTSPESPLSCNILNARVVIECTVESVGRVFTIGWFYSETEAMAALSSQTTLIPDTDARYRMTSKIIDFGEGRESSLVIDPYDATYNGFYWCDIQNIQPVPSAFINPSQVVHIKSNFTLEQLSSCTEEVEFSETGKRCALGDTETQKVEIVIGAVFTNISSTTPVITPTATTTTTTTTTTIVPSIVLTPTTIVPSIVPTPTPVTTTNTTEEATTTEEKNSTEAVTTVTMENTTMIPTDETMTTATVEDTGSGNSGDLIRTALIWFAVGGSVFILLSIGVILCVVGLAKA